MTRKNPPARYTLPADPHPDTSICVQILIPNDPMHLAAFQGQVKALASAYAWQNDDDHTALLAAEAWLPVFDNLCLDPDPCGVEAPSILCIGGSFADLSYGFVPAIAAPCSPVYVSGVGFQSCHDTGDDNEQIRLIRPFSSPTFVRHIKFRFTSTTPSVPYTASVDLLFEGSSVYHFDDFLPFGGGYLLDQTVEKQADIVLVQQLGEPGGTGVLTLEEFELCYTGDFPLSEPAARFTHTFDFTVGDQG